MIERITFGVFNNAGDAYFACYCLRANLDSIAETFNVWIVDELIPNIMGSLLRRNGMRLGRQSPAGRMRLAWECAWILVADCKRLAD
jgi:hypothetical protein